MCSCPNVARSSKALDILQYFPWAGTSPTLPHGTSRIGDSTICSVLRTQGLRVDEELAISDTCFPAVHGPAWGQLRTSSALFEYVPLV